MLCSNIDSKIKWRNAMEPIEFSKLVSEEIGLGVHWQNIHKYIKSNICKDFKVRKKNKALPQFPPSIMFEEIGLKEKEVQATMKHVNQHMDKKLKEALKKFNGNAKKLLKEVKQPSSIHRSLEILLEMVGGMSGATYNMSKNQVYTFKKVFKEKDDESPLLNNQEPLSGRKIAFFGHLQFTHEIMKEMGIHLGAIIVSLHQADFVFVSVKSLQTMDKVKKEELQGKKFCLSGFFYRFSLNKLESVMLLIMKFQRILK
eukprot:TRINITY_DN1049_c0_g1_i4.p1 TRINITY_DN1049_c0_g1~~TRINITY_DN1049_c0_g1_i4.p1  ORF type:complete len:257 (-),score=52.04 TRINITY_DN1049_c0_g1_i4:926-1696(-)